MDILETPQYDVFHSKTTEILKDKINFLL
jgi:hypothetical protein